MRVPIGVDLIKNLYALDTTTIDLCLSVFPWAEGSSPKAAIKLHTLLDLRGNIPTFIHISDGEVHDVNILDESCRNPVRFTSWIEVISIFSVSSFSHSARPSLSCAPNRMYYPETLLASSGQEYWRALGSDRHPHIVRISISISRSLRRVSYLDKETQKRLKFLTNNFVLPAFTIAQIYKCRWQMELFFESSTWCTPSDVMEFQEPVALNRPLVGSLDGCVRPCIARRLLCA